LSIHIVKLQLCGWRGGMDGAAVKQKFGWMARRMGGAAVKLQLDGWRGGWVARTLSYS